MPSAFSDSQAFSRTSRRRPEMTTAAPCRPVGRGGLGWGAPFQSRPLVTPCGRPTPPVPCPGGHPATKAPSSTSLPAHPFQQT